MLEVDDRQNVPSVVLFSKEGSHIGYGAIESAVDATDLNENFKLSLGESAPSRLDPPKFDTGDGRQRSAHEITKVYIESLLKAVSPWIASKGLTVAKRVLVAEPLALDRTDKEGADWLHNYRAKIKAILNPHFEEVDFLSRAICCFSILSIWNTAPTPQQ